MILNQSTLFFKLFEFLSDLYLEKYEQNIKIHFLAKKKRAVILLRGKSRWTRLDLKKNKKIPLKKNLINWLR